MKYTKSVIESFAYHDPETFLSSDELEKRLSPIYDRLKLPYGRLELQTSIKSRGFWPVGTKPSSISTGAAVKALEKSQFKNTDIDLLIHSSVCRDFLEPSTASTIHNLLQLKPECISFDLSNACLGFVNAISVACEMIENGAIKTALIVSGENSGPLLEETITKLNSDELITRKSIKKYIANLTIGSSGVAFILSHHDLCPDGHKILGGYSLSDSSASTLCQGSGDSTSLMMETESEALLHAGIELAKKTWTRTQAELNLSEKDFSHLICHQVGIAHRNLMYSELELNIDKDHTTFDQYGNTGSAALPLTFIKACESGKIAKGDNIALLGIGSGLHSIMLGLEY
jgi:3-oxoacyl-[acyl-carrier-protein] synthase III